MTVDQTMQYVRSLEQRIKQLEEDKSMLQARTQAWPPNAAPNDMWEGPRSPGDEFHLGSRPEAVVRALQVLEVREQLEREAGHDAEKALAREMCNVSFDIFMLHHYTLYTLKYTLRNFNAYSYFGFQVVWRKLEEGPMQNRH